MIHNAKRKVIRPSRPDPGPRPAGELGVLFDQSPIAMVFSDRDLRTRRTNAAFRRLAGLPDEALTGRRPSETDPGDRIMDTALIEHALAEQVISRGVPVVDVHLESTMAGERRVFSWSAYRLTDNGQVLGVLGSLTDITGRVQAVTALRQAYARLDLLQRAGSQIGTTLDIRRTAGGLAAPALPDLADRVAVDLCDQVLHGEEPPRARPRGRRCTSTPPGCTPASTTRRSLGSAACCPATSRRWRGCRSRTATSRPAGPRRSAATGSTSSPSTPGRWRWWSAT